MYIPRTNNEVDGCPPGRATCSTASSDPSPTGPYDTVPGVHRFIGISMVIVMAFLVLIGWLYYANYPRRKFPFLYRWGRKRRGTVANDAEDMDVDDATQSTIMVADGSSSSGKLKEAISIGSLQHQQHARQVPDEDDDDDKTKCNLSVDVVACASSSRKARRSPPGKPKSNRKQGQRQGREDNYKRPTREERARTLEKTRNKMLQAEPRGVVKQVSGGMVMYTEAPRAPAPVVVRPPRGRPPRQQQQSVTADWQFEHVQGVRFEVSVVSPF